MNQDITLSEFKVIYYWEYFHRLLGRFIGLLFLIPFIYFLIKKVFTKEYNIKLSIIFCLILFQGFIGWYMVKSGLTENTTVSHFRLAIHLNIALILFSTIFWYFLNFLTKENKLFFYSYSGEKKIKIFVFIIFLQVTLGAFVSGLDAGQIYQTWPLMNDGYFPDDVNLYKIKISKIFYDPSLMQFLHRNLAYLISVYIIFIAIYIFYKKKKDLYFPVSILLFFVFVQVIMGILTLLSGLNILYASLHQLSSLLLLASSIYLCHKSIN